jgi:hypothetical protein
VGRTPRPRGSYRAGCRGAWRCELQDSGRGA